MAVITFFTVGIVAFLIGCLINMLVPVDEFVRGSWKEKTGIVVLFSVVIFGISFFVVVFIVLYNYLVASI